MPLDRPMTMDVPDGPARFQELCRTLLGMEVPDGYRAEIIRGNIVMSPWPPGYHFFVMKRLQELLHTHAPAQHAVFGSPFLFTFPGAERAYGPDVYVAARSAFHTESRFLEGEALSLVAELTSPTTRDDDLTEKPTVYGRAGVPVYLLLDMQEQESTVFWGPAERGYDRHLTLPFGELLHIPNPFDCDLDTSGFGPPKGVGTSETHPG